MPALTNEPRPLGLVRLEWSVATISLFGGGAIAFVGVTYGLINVTGVGAGFFPTVAGILVSLSGLLWLLQLAFTRRADAASSVETVDKSFEDVTHRFEVDDEIDEDAEEAEFPDRAGWLRVGIIVAAVLGAAQVLPVIGYTLSMTLMLAVVLFFVSKRPWWLALVVGIGAALVSRLVFESWLGTELPASSIDFLATLGL
ncbi:MAG: tripartite tricarboxylate transporter TctB family protein [Mycobacterium sp.]